MLSPYNKTKTSITPINKVLQGVFLITENEEFLTQEDDGYLIYDAVNYGITVINQTKTPFGTITIQAGTPMGLLLSITYPTTFAIGSGVVNQVKS